jgi:non-homologous end joining protein Ku
MPLIQQLIKKQTRPWDSKLVADPVQDKLLEIIEAKRKKTKRPAKAKASEPKATKADDSLGVCLIAKAKFRVIRMARGP